MPRSRGTVIAASRRVSVLSAAGHASRAGAPRGRRREPRRAHSSRLPAQGRMLVSRQSTGTWNARGWGEATDRSGEYAACRRTQLPRDVANPASSRRSIRREPWLVGSRATRACELGGHEPRHAHRLPRGDGLRIVAAEARKTGCSEPTAAAEQPAWDTARATRSLREGGAVVLRQVEAVAAWRRGCPASATWRGKRQERREVGRAGESQPVIDGPGGSSRTIGTSTAR